MRHPGGGGNRNPWSIIAIAWKLIQFIGIGIDQIDSKYLQISMLFKRFVSETPYLIHDTAKAPHITGSRVLLVVNGLKVNIHTSHITQVNL